ncbi:MAG: hypothetical protein HYX52_06745 [Chloroflexi bacterium]|nr:hypothetical protein [Chloroflexota bacterium]
MSALEALPPAAFFLFLEAAVGGTILLLLVQARGDVTRGFTLFTGWLFWTCAVLALGLRLAFPPSADWRLDPTDAFWYGAERALTMAFTGLLLLYLVALQRGAANAASVLQPAVQLTGLGGLWAAAVLHSGPQLSGLGAPLAVVAGAVSLGSALAGLSLGHWYLVAPTLSVRPLLQLTFTCLGAIGLQILLLPVLLLTGDGAAPARVLIEQQSLFFAVRMLFGLAVPFAVMVAVWRTARIRSLDSATGLLYVAATLILVGEISARSLYFLTGIAT